jgi:molecular chaperone IbpA
MGWPIWNRFLKDTPMRSFDFAPLYRATIGFDIEKTAEDGYCISIAVAGFAEADLGIEVKENTLHVSARKPEPSEEKTYLHRGIATRAFDRQFHLADHVRATGASHVDGMLHIDLVREVPEALKPRRIEIQSKAPSKAEAAVV